MWNNVVYLGTLNKTINDIADTVKIIIYDKEIFCNEKSIRSSEFYQAHAVGMKPEISITVKQADYNNEKYVKYVDVEYTILRTYKTDSENIDLTLVRSVNNATA